jgi:hypothetical protein
MNLEFVVGTSPGSKTWLITELRLEFGQIDTGKTWAGLWLTYWVFKPKFWREWLWEFEKTNESRWRVFKVRFLGLEITLQHRRGQYD